MFGYVRPLVGELKVREYEAYRSCYCGLCRTLGREYGPLARLFLNYDFTFLAMLLWEPGTPAGACRRRCAAYPFRRHPVCGDCEALRRSAGYSVILSWWKLQDTIRDERGMRALGARLSALALRRAYRRASGRFSAYDSAVRQGLEILHQRESEGETSLDRAADPFACILSACALGYEGSRGRALRQLLYHVGRWIYITDAADDWKRDAETGSYNAVHRRYVQEDGVFDKAEKEQVRVTLAQSAGLAGAAFELLEETCWSQILRNILYFGLESVSVQVLNGTFRQKRDEPYR